MTRQEFQDKIWTLTEAFRALMRDPNVTREDIDAAQEKIDKLNEEWRAEEFRKNVREYNRKQDEKRETLRLLLSMSLPSEDITNADGSFHAVKIRKFHELEKLAKEKRVKIRLEYGAPYCVTVSGNSYNMFKVNYSSAGSTTEAFKDFSEACEVNGILIKPLTLARAAKEVEAIRKESVKIQEKVKAYRQRTSALGHRMYEAAGILQTYEEHLPTYR